MKRLLKLIYPPCCPICDRILNEKEGKCCSKCKAALPRVTGTVCMKCGKPVREGQEYCVDCKTQFHYYTEGVAAFTYSKGLPDSLYRMKYQNRRDYIEFFAESMLLAYQKKQKKWRVQVILPVPMHWIKRARRGYNQSELLAEVLSRRTGLPVMKKWGRPVRRTGEQKRLSRRERQKNLKDSIQVQMDFTGIKRVLIVDDVYTTGSTMDELARILKLHGVEEIYFVVLCIGKR